MAGVAVIGNLARDRLDHGPPRVGGAPYYAARALRLLRCPARLVTRCAAEDRDVLVPPLTALGLPVTWHATASTAAFSFSYAGGERAMTVDSLGDPWTVADVSSWARRPIARAKWIHVGALHRGDFPGETLAALARGRRLLLDAQGLVRAPETGALRLAADEEETARALAAVQVLKLAEAEAAALAGDVTVAVIRSLGVPEVLVTLGERGLLAVAGRRAEHVPARRIRAADPTGAGDALAAAYVASRDAGHAPVPAARRAASVVADLLASR